MEEKTTTKKKSSKYRVTLYLGKENYERLGTYAKVLNMPIATLCRVLLETGLMFADIEESKKQRGVKNDK